MDASVDAQSLLARLRARMSQPTWVTVAGFGSGRVHASVLAYALSQPHLGRKRLLAALWQEATGEVLDPGAIGDDDLVVRRDERLMEGADGVVDLLVVFHVGEERWRLGVEVKVDALPRREQGARLLEGIQQRGGARNALLLIAIGISQVSLQGVTAESEEPVWTTRTVDTLLALGPKIRAAAGVDYVVEPWIEEIEAERWRRILAPEVSLDQAEELGYRGRSLVAYKLGDLCERTNEATGASWQLSMRPAGIIARADTLTRCKLTPRQKIWFNLELGESELSLKAWSEPQLPDLRKDTDLIATQACRLFWAQGLLAAPPTHPRIGPASTLLTIPLRATSHAGFSTLVRACRAWQSVATALDLRTSLSQRSMH